MTEITTGVERSKPSVNGPTGKQNTGRPAELEKTSAPTVLALVFDRLSPEGRAAAYKGALGILDTLQEADYVAVYISDLSLVMMQEYTNDRDAIFSMAQAVLIRPLPIVEPGRVMLLWGRDDAHSQQVVEVSLQDQRAWLAGQKSFSAIGLFGSVNWGELHVAGPGQPFRAVQNAPARFAIGRSPPA